VLLLYSFHKIMQHGSLTLAAAWITVGPLQSLVQLFILDPEALQCLVTGKLLQDLQIQKDAQLLAICKLTQHHALQASCWAADLVVLLCQQQLAAASEESPSVLAARNTLQQQSRG
jgi:hypothetical protein